MREAVMRVIHRLEAVEWEGTREGQRGVQYEEEDDNDEEEDSDEELPDPELRPPTTKIPGTMVVAVYEGEWFIAEVMEEQERGVPGGYTRLKFMAIKGNNVFAWPNKEDRVITYNEDILLENIDPIPLNSRGHFGLNEKDLKRVQSWMVVVYCPFIPWSFLFYFKIFNNFTVKNWLLFCPSDSRKQEIDHNLF